MRRGAPSNTAPLMRGMVATAFVIADAGSAARHRRECEGNSIKR
jgi:hypothetical protein